MKTFLAAISFVASFCIFGLVDSAGGDIQYVITGMMRLAPFAAIGFALGNWRSPTKHSLFSSIASGIVTYSCAQFAYVSFHFDSLLTVCVLSFVLSFVAGLFYAPVLNRIATSLRLPKLLSSELTIHSSRPPGSGNS